jgi:hypothetical protein
MTMGILDELRDESKRKKFIEESEHISAEKLAENYQKNVLPKMQMVFDFFKEIVDHLQYLKNPIRVYDYSNKYPGLGELKQYNYKLSSDKYGGMSHYNELRDVKIRFYCIGEDALEFDVKTQTEIDQHIKFLTAKKVPFEWSRHHNNVKNSFATFVVEKKIPVKISFHADYNQSVINLEITNHLNFGHIQRSYKPEELNSDVLDQLAKFLLRKDSTFIEEEMSAEQKQILRDNLRKNINFGDNEKNIKQEETQKKRSLFGKIGSMFNRQ